MTSCPICGKPVDSLRAPAVGVRDGKVVSYCSKECAAMAESGPAKLIPTKIVRVPSNSELVSGERKAVVTPASGVVAAPAPGGPLDSGPIIEITREPSRPVPSRKRADSSVQVADTGRVDDFITHEPRRRGLVIAIALVLVLLGGAAAAYFLYFNRQAQPEPVVVARDAAVAAVTVDAQPAITRDVALARAHEVLRLHLASESPRVQRLAAAALARTGDDAAREVLAKALGSEESNIANVKLAYALARGGDERGLNALVTAAGADRESKHEAGSRLALLGDKRAIRILQDSLRYPQFRLGVAEQLAYIAEPRALKILDEVRADPKALPDEKARAAIALAWAGRADIAPVLRELLADSRENAYAAAALANLRDEAARPVLEQQLDVPSLRVQAARGLRRLAPDADVTALLPKVVDALAKETKDTEQVPIAEALLLLAGPPAWSERY